MKYLEIDQTKIPYKITKKKIKNTYFYFKKEGYIQINLSTYQTESEAIDYIRKNKQKFLYKLSNSKSQKPYNENEFLLRGKVYNIVLTDKENITFEEDIAYLPSKDITTPLIKSFYKNEMMKVIKFLHDKYQNNAYIDLSGVTYRTRYTSSRHGSCNARKRNINLNLHLVKYDVLYIEYVFLHEIAHLNHQNHGPEFYSLLKKLCPNYKQIKRELKEIYR